MRLYNAHSCTPMAITSKLQSNSSFPPHDFLPAPKKKRSIKVDKSQIDESKRSILERYSQTTKRLDGSESRDEQESDRRTGLEGNREACEKPHPPSSTDIPVEQVLPIEESTSISSEEKPPATQMGDKPTGSCHFSFPRKKTGMTKKRVSAFHSPLRIAKYSFQSPPPPSTRTLSTNTTTLDLVFSPRDGHEVVYDDASPQISKNETSTTAATSDIELEPVRSDASFLFDIEVVKSDTDAPAKMMLETGSVVSKSSSSTLTSNFAFCRVRDHAAENPFDELEMDMADSRLMFSPIPWKPKNTTIDTTKLTRVETSKVTSGHSLWTEIPTAKNLFRGAWFDSRGSSSDGLSQEDSWIDFTDDPFKTHGSIALEKPCPSKPDILSNEPTPDWAPDSDGFVVKKTLEKQTMEHYSSRASNSGASEISFPSLSGGNTTWSQVEITENHGKEPIAKWAPLPIKALPGQSKLRPSQLQQQHRRATRLLGHVLQSRFEATRKILDNKNRYALNSTKGNRVSKEFCKTPCLLPSHASVEHNRKYPQHSEHAASIVSDDIRIEKEAVVDSEWKIRNVCSKTLPYAKMLSRGIRTEAVKAKMERDGVDVSLVFPCAHTSSAHTGIHSDNGATFPCKDVPCEERVRHFRIHCETQSEMGHNPLWHKVQRDEAWLQETIQVDENEFMLRVSFGQRRTLANVSMAQSKGLNYR